MKRKKDQLLSYKSQRLKQNISKLGNENKTFKRLATKWPYSQIKAAFNLIEKKRKRKKKK